MRKVALLLSKPARVLEVGSWIGESALLWANAIGMGSITCVDTWSPYASKHDLACSGNPVYGRMDEALASGKAYDEFVQAMKSMPAGVQAGHFVGILIDAIAASAVYGYYDLVYLDGSHYLDAVRLDIALARGLVTNGGILCGDDLELQGDQIDLDGAKKMTDVDYIGGSYHPGVSVAVWEQFGRVWSDNGFWAVQKVDMSWKSPFA